MPGNKVRTQGAPRRPRSLVRMRSWTMCQKIGYGLVVIVVASLFAGALNWGIGFLIEFLWETERISYGTRKKYSDWQDLATVLGVGGLFICQLWFWPKVLHFFWSATSMKYTTFDFYLGRSESEIDSEQPYNDRPSNHEFFIAMDQAVQHSRSEDTAGKAASDEDVQNVSTPSTHSTATVSVVRPEAEAAAIQETQSSSSLDSTNSQRIKVVQVCETCEQNQGRYRELERVNFMINAKATELHSANEALTKAQLSQEQEATKTEVQSTEMAEARARQETKILELMEANERLLKAQQLCNQELIQLEQVKKDLSDKLQEHGSEVQRLQELHQVSVQDQEGQEQKLVELRQSRDDLMKDFRRQTEELARLHHVIDELRDLNQQQGLEIVELQAQIDFFIRQKFAARTDVWLLLRIRPAETSKTEKQHAMFTVNPPQDLLVKSVQPSADGSKSTVTERAFQFDHIFDEGCPERDVTEEVRPMIQAVLAGTNVSIIADGQSGTGKSFTMFQSRESIHRYAAHEFFKHVASHADQDDTYIVKYSAREVYAKTVTDLLAVQDSADNHVRPLRAGSFDPVFLEIPSEDELEKRLVEVLHRRITRATVKNQTSSRSHLICIIRLERITKQKHKAFSSDLYLVDLAGSEKLDKDGANSLQIEETRGINTSRSHLHRAISAVRKGKRVPYNDNVLTKALRSCLVPHAKTVLFIHISPHAEDLNSTLYSLKEAAGVTAATPVSSAAEQA